MFIFQVGFGKSMATPVVWLGNLADTVHEGFLCRQFSRFGALSHTVVDKENHRGLVFFLNPESAQYALPEMRNRIWNGKKIHVSSAEKTRVFTKILCSLFFLIYLNLIFKVHLYLNSNYAKKKFKYSV